MLPSLKLCIKDDYIRQDGTVNIRLRVIFRRKVKYYPLDVLVKPNHYLAGKVSKADPDHFRKNLILEKFMLKAKDIMIDLLLHDQSFTFDLFTNMFLDKNYGDESFYAFADNYIDQHKGIVSKETTKMYKSQINKLKEFKKTLSFNDISVTFLNDFEKFLVMDKKNNQNTIAKTFTIIKSILNRAVEAGKIKEHAFTRYRFTSPGGNREFLTMEELQELEDKLHNESLSRSQLNVLRYFLFSCYTGIRYQDLKNLRYSNIINNQTVAITMHKTRRTVKIPLSERAKALIPVGRFQGMTVFKVLSNQPTNRYLKDIMRAAGINKMISFHCSRHTFATVCLDLGMSLETVKEILGHTDIKTTAIYGRIREGRTKKEMDRWNTPGDEK